MIRSRTIAIAASLALALTPLAPLPALATGGFSGGQKCAPKGGGDINIYKPVTINKNINIDKSISIYKPITINKNINIDKSIYIKKNIDLSKKININKTIIINKGKASAKAEAFASAAAFARASSRSTAIAYGGGGYVENVTHYGGGDIGGIAVEEACVEQWATLVKAVHAVCVSRSGRSHPAARMRHETWIDASYSGEIYRCLDGSWLRAVIGHVVDSDEGMAAVYDGGETMECRAGESLRHFADGMVKCAASEPVPECTERRNLRNWGAGDIFFSFQTKVCARSYSASASYSVKMSHGYRGSFRGGSGSYSSELELNGLSLSGGVGY